MPTDPERIWKREEPPADQVERHDKMRGRPKGAWGKYLAYCAQHPNQSFRSHPIMARHTAQQAASEIQHWKLIAGQAELGVTPEDGEWICRWGHAPDDNHLENWYVWTKWVPKKVVRSQSNGKTKAAPTPRKKAQ